MKNRQTIMGRPTIFIGSSSEGKATARAVKEQFDADADVDVWDEDVFQLNSSYLESLLRAASLYDFAILVFSADDVTTSRGVAQQVPRDNILFEHGLFLGRLGPKRAFVLCEETVKIPSDFAGITVAKYRHREDGNLKSSVSVGCNQIRKAIEIQSQRSEIGLLPSTALAIGYHENFVRKVVAELQNGRNKPARVSGIKKLIREYTEAGAEQEKSIPITYRDFILRILVPTNISELMPDGLRNWTQNLLHISLKTPFRPFPFYIRADQKHLEQSSTLELFDIPTTLLASRQAIEMMLGNESIGPSKDRDKLEKREIANFKLTLENLRKRNFGDNTPYLQIQDINSLASLVGEDGG